MSPPACISSNSEMSARGHVRHVNEQYVIRGTTLWQGGGIGENAPGKVWIYSTLAFPGPTYRERTGRQYPQDLNLGICSCTTRPSQRPNREGTEGHFRLRGQGPIHKYNSVCAADQQDWKT